MQRRTACLLAAAASLVSGCATTGDELGLQVLETADMRMIHGGNEAYLVPHAARSFENSLAFQRKTFEWTPWEKNTVVLTDLSDGVLTITLNRPEVLNAYNMTLHHALLAALDEGRFPGDPMPEEARRDEERA